MKNKLAIIAASLLTILIVNACRDSFLDLQPKDRITVNALLSSPEGVNAALANLYGDLPIEDLNYDWGGNFAWGASQFMAALTPEMRHIVWGHWINNPKQESFNFFNNWDSYYAYIYRVNQFSAVLKTLDVIKDEQKKVLQGETHFLKAYTYYALARRYGGLPIINVAQNYNGDAATLKVPRSTESKTYRYIIEQCDSAALFLPSINGKRATKWAAVALKSRVALTAASLAKFWKLAPLSGPAVDQKLVGGMDASDQTYFYQQCINSSAEIMNPSSGFGLYQPVPSTPEAASENYRKLFYDATSCAPEIIFSKGYAYPSSGTSIQFWHEPNQTTSAWAAFAEPTLEMVESYEDFNNGSGGNRKIVTTTDGNENYTGYAKTLNYKRYDNVTDIFMNKDPRLYASVITPGSVWKNTVIVIQGGIVKPDGSAIWMAKGEYNFNGKTYYSWGASTPANYSGFDYTGAAKFTASGFTLKKYFDEKFIPDPEILKKNTQEFPEMRYAEVLLNYAEAVAESGLTGPFDATAALNETRRRAGFTNTLPLTSENVQKERACELAMEPIRFWDYIRRRALHTIYTGTYQSHNLVPMVDFTTGTEKFIFVRYEQNSIGARQWYNYAYYRPIPGIGGNSLIQNPDFDF